MFSDSAPLLHQLAAAAGLELSSALEDPAGVNEEVLAAACTAIGFDVSSPEAIAASLDELRQRQYSRPFPPTLVIDKNKKMRLRMNARPGVDYELLLTLENGSRLTPAAVFTSKDAPLADESWESRSVKLRNLPLGYHELTVRESDSGDVHSTLLIVVPGAQRLPDEARGWGLFTNVYGVRSERSWGLGDIADLAELAVWSAGEGAQFTRMIPLRAADPAPIMSANPYQPVSSQYINPLYVRIEEAPEIGYLSAAEHQILEWHADDARRMNADSEIDRDATWTAKRAALFMVFGTDRSQRRHTDFESFVAAAGEDLVDFATWCVLAEQHGLPWSSWPEELQDPHSEAVTAFRDAHWRTIEFHCWMQWVATRQLRKAHQESLEAGMAIGFLSDVTRNVARDGFETWRYPQRFAPGMALGAPGENTQMMQLAAELPQATVDSRFGAWRRALQAALSVSGGVHLHDPSSLFRSLWLVADSDGSDGVWIRHDHHALLGIALLEAHRAGGVVTAGVPREAHHGIELRERGVPPTVLAFSTDDDELADMTPLSVAAVSTVFSDSPATVLQSGQISNVQKSLREAGYLGEFVGIDDEVAAVYRHLMDSPSRLVSVSVADLVCSQEPGESANGEQDHRGWRKPLTDAESQQVTLDSLLASRRAKRLLRFLGT